MNDVHIQSHCVFVHPPVSLYEDERDNTSHAMSVIQVRSNLLPVASTRMHSYQDNILIEKIFNCLHFVGVVDGWKDAWW